jgi:hypothetical protein
MQSNPFNFDLEPKPAAEEEYNEDIESNIDNISDQYAEFIK